MAKDQKNKRIGKKEMVCGFNQLWLRGFGYLVTEYAQLLNGCSFLASLPLERHPVAKTVYISKPSSLVPCPRTF